ncbi:MAG: glycosyltransferase [Bacillales bacterium]|jgi:glycosyltransferase involved in cell wall biosynthesis|nr:glycosyltransferase [Bacillales bacterium]
MESLISVIVPVYKAEKYLEKCIKSILNQTYRHFELILVEDGSPDQCAEICDLFAMKDSRIRVIHQENAGVSKSRNVGIDVAKGKYITFVDSDDYIEQTFLEKAILAIESAEADLYIGGIKMETFSGDLLIKEETLQGKKKSYTSKILLEKRDIDYPMILICGPCCKLYKRDILDKNQIRFEPDLSLGEDTYFNMEYLIHCEEVIFSDENFYHYQRINSDSLYTKYRADYFEVHVKVFGKVLNTYEQLNCSKESIIQFKQLFGELLISSITNDFEQGAKISATCKLKTIKKVSNNAVVKEYLRYNSGKSISQILLFNLIKIGAVRFIYAQQSLIRWIKSI